MNGDQVLNIIISAKDQASAVLDKFSRKLQGNKAEFQKMAAIGTASFAAIGYGAIKMFQQYADAEAQTVITNQSLANSFKNLSEKELKNLEKAVGSTQNVLGSLQESAKRAGDAAIKLGFDDETTARSFAKLFAVTKDVAKANNELAIAQDLARFKGISLEEATQKLVLVHSGATKELKALGLQVDDTATAEENLQAIHKQTADASKKFAETSQGAMEVLKVQTDNLKEAIGKALAPAFLKLIEAVTPVIEKFTAWAEKNPELLSKLILLSLALAGLVAVVGTLGVIMPAVISGFTLLAGPVGIVAGIIVALIPVVMLLIELWPELKETVQTAFYNIGETILAFWNAFTTSINTQIKWLEYYWGRIQKGFIDAWTSIKNFFISIWEGIKNSFKNIWDAIVNVVDAAIQKITGFLKPIIKMVDGLISKIASIGGGAVSGIKSIGSKVANFLGFEHGGLVPGAVGQAVPIIAHGGEQVIPASQSVNGAGSMSIVLNLNYPQFKNQDDVNTVKDQINNALRDVMRNHKLITI